MMATRMELFLRSSEPAEAIQIDPLSCEYDSLSLQQLFLYDVRPILSWQRDFPLGVDDTVPRDVCPTRQMMKCIADESRLSRKTALFSYFAVGRDSSSRNLSDCFPYQLVLAGAVSLCHSGGVNRGFVLKSVRSATLGAD